MADRRPAAAAGSRGATAAPKKYGDRRYRGKHPREGAAAAAASVPDDETYEEEWADEWAGEDWAEDDDEESEIPPSSAEFRRTRGDRKKWRGGPCPAPPPLEARFQNIYKQPRYYQKWVRKVHMWKARARHYKPMAELALDLSDVITGEGAEMIESLEWTRLYSQDGIDLVINSLAVFDEQQILQVGDLMEEYEEVERLPGELLAAYVAHFKDLEMRLKRAELPAQQGQFRAFKLLRSSCLSPEVRRNLLLATGNEYDFDRLVQADIIPEDEAEENEDEDDPDQAEVNEAYAEEVDSIQVMQEVADALTVTSDKLKKLTLGRGWTGSAARQAAADIVSTATERHCDAAGRHVFFRKHSWNIYGRPIRRFKSTGGISEARVSPDVFEDRLQVTHLSPDELQQRVAAFKSRVATSDKGASHVRFQATPEVRQFSVDSRGAQAARSGTKSSHQVDVIWHVRTPLDVCFLEDSQGFYIVIDTGCQRNVVGYECLGKFLEHIAYLGLSFWEAEEQERLRFGVSRAVSKSVVYFPICLEHVVPLVCRTSVLDVNPKLPFLGSLPMRKLLGLQLDTLGERAHFTKINLCDVPLKIAPNGHLLLRVDSWLKDVGFPRGPEAWKFTPSDVIIPEPQWIPEAPACVSGESCAQAESQPMQFSRAALCALTSTHRGLRQPREVLPSVPDGCNLTDATPVFESILVQLTRQNLAINAWTNLMQLIMNHLSHIIGRSREQFRQNTEMSNRMMGAIAQMGHEMGYLTPMADSVKAIARGAAQVPESVLPPPPAPEDQAQNYSQLCEKRDVCAHPTTRRYYAKGYWLICDQCGRRWKSVNGKSCFNNAESPGQVFGELEPGSYADQGGAKVTLGAASPASGTEMVKRGAWKRLLGIAKKTTAACETLINVSQDADRRAADLRDAEWCCSDVAFMDIPVPELPDHRHLDNECQACGTDLIEGCAGTARPTRLASRFELRASPSADIEDGWDLSTTRGAQRWKDQILKDKPLYVIVGFPCTLWCSYNVNVNYVDHPELLERLRARDRRLIDLIKWTIKYQVKHGRFFLFENPPTSAIWKDLQFAPLLPLGETVIGHGCQYGKTGKTGLPIRKAHRWFSNSPPALAALSRRCPGLRPESGGHLHDQIENSKWTKASGEYTDEMAHAMLHAIQQVAAQRNPSRLADMPVAATEWEVAYNHAGPIEVLFASPEKDPTRWEAVMQGVRQIVGGSASRARPVSGGHLHDQIENSKWTKASGEYTDEMAHAMLHAIQQVAAQRNPSRLADMPVAATEWEVAYNHAGPIEVLFASPEKDPTRWEAVMQGVRQIVGGSASRGGNKAMHYLSKSSALWRQISQLVPWDLTMIQLAKSAKQRRFPINKEPWSHRGHCYVDEKGHYHIEAEDLVDVAFPTLALSPPADLAVFFFGYAKQESLPQEPDTSQIEKRMPLPPDPNDPMLPNNSLPPDEDDDLQDVPIARMPDASGGMAGIRFVGVTKEQCPREVRQPVARMHCNLGHPVPSEFFQFLAQRGASQATLLCARALRCPACLRRKRPQRQRESQIPRVGLFNDLVKGDLFYVMTHDGDVWEKFQTCWLTPFGIMQILVVDRDGAFEAVFMDNCHTLGIDVRYVPPGAHWQLGLAESGNYAWRRVFEKVIDVILPTMPEHVDLAIISTSHAVNQSVRRAGRTAYAAAFGRVPTLPTELLADTTSAEFWHNCTQDEMLAYGGRCRIEALKAIADLEADEALRTSILRQPVNRKEYDFLSGQRVAAWGEHGRKRRGKTPVAGYRPGIFCFWDSGTNGYGEGESAWLRIGHRTVQVAREHIRPAVGFEGWTPSEEDLKELKTAEQDLAKAGQGDASPERYPASSPESSRRRSSRARCALSVAGTASVWTSQNTRALCDAHAEEISTSYPRVVRSSTTIERFGTFDGYRTTTGDPRVLEPGGVQEAYEAHLLPIENFENDPIDDSEPDDDWTNCLYMTYHELSDLRDGEMDVDCATAQVGDTTDSNNLSRREQRQLDREIPWREIAEYPEDQFMEYVKSQGLAQGVPELGHLEAKARPVLLGFSDPDLEKLPRNAPVLTDAGKKLICQIAVSNDWRVGTGDAESAFLQGGAQSEREEAIYMIPPKDPIVQAAGVFTAPLYEVVGNLYGQSTAPYLWYKHVVTTFLALGSKLHSLDSALFLWFFPNNELACAVGMHVDDALAAHHPKFDFTPIEKAIKWRGWQWDNFVFLGEEYQRLRQGPYSGSLFVHQAAYTKAIAVTKVGVMSSTRSSSKLTRSEREDLESAVGSLQWLSGHTRPDLSAAVSLVQRTDPELNDLRMAMKHVEYAHRTAQTGILIVRVDLSRACFVSFADSSWANAPGLKTQIGTLIFLADKVILTGPTSCTLLFHKSKRTPRVVRSTLAGEAIAQDLGVDYASHLSKFLSEMLTGRPAGRHPPIFEVITVTDCKSLHDALHQLTPSLSEKRTVFDVISIRDEVKVKNVRWIPTTHMIADGMTKEDPKLRENLTKFLADPVLSLVESIACEELTGGDGQVQKK
ncbi:unnamed protein product [Prorocentrum cordatum]|uniref:Reverse transcriptase Ty1/copia-type domain-containing protein n=1 Tax=Prorocentrum cordatum TaxID=2364126 RepID=A0ABN9RV43_9DINO|nr:unnamed protein product [Polarella glacialis]